MKYFTGIDVSLRSVSICVVDEAGVVQYEAKAAAEIDVIVAARRVRLGIPPMRIEGAERLLDLATFLAFVWASPWPETVRAGSPSRALDAILIFLPYWAAATARFAGAVMARPV